MAQCLNRRQRQILCGAAVAAIAADSLPFGCNENERRRTAEYVYVCVSPMANGFCMVLVCFSLFFNVFLYFNVQMHLLVFPSFFLCVGQFFWLFSQWVYLCFFYLFFLCFSLCLAHSERHRQRQCEGYLSAAVGNRCANPQWRQTHAEALWGIRWTDAADEWFIASEIHRNQSLTHSIWRSA